MSSRPELRLDWCSYEAAKYAVEHWHYSGSLPGARRVYVGVWEMDQFVGAVVFGLGSGFATNGTRFGLARSHEIAELCRVALRHHATPVSRILAIALKMIHAQSPGLRLIISFADPMHQHVGGIYQAGGWVYSGVTKGDVEYFQDGRWRHHRSATSRAMTVAGLPSRPLLPKHRYLYPLDAEMRQRLLPLSQPYPKRAKDSSEPPADHAGEGAAAATRTLQNPFPLQARLKALTHAR